MSHEQSAGDWLGVQVVVVGSVKLQALAHESSAQSTMGRKADALSCSSAEQSPPAHESTSERCAAQSAFAQHASSAFEQVCARQAPHVVSAFAIEHVVEN
jgi:hypothetical protein